MILKRTLHPTADLIEVFVCAPAKQILGRLGSKATLS